jgi:hypothetical protein
MNQISTKLKMTTPQRTLLKNEKPSKWKKMFANSIISDKEFVSEYVKKFYNSRIKNK